MTSLDSDGRLNIAPMGPIVQGNFASLILRPFQTSTTFSNLNETNCGVFHVVDRVELLARAAIGTLTENPPTRPASLILGWILEDCCRWFEFRITERDLSNPRSVMRAEIVSCGEQRPFFGFNRARHAVIEAAILATRVHLLDRAEVTRLFAFLEVAVEKTGDAAEVEIFQMLHSHVHDFYAGEGNDIR